MKLDSTRVVIFYLCITVLFASSRNRDDPPLLSHRPPQYYKNVQNQFPYTFTQQIPNIQRFKRQDDASTSNPETTEIPLQTESGQNETHLNETSDFEDFTFTEDLESLTEPETVEYEEVEYYIETDQDETAAEESESEDVAEEKKGKSKKKKKKSKYKNPRPIKRPKSKPVRPRPVNKPARPIKKPNQKYPQKYPYGMHYGHPPPGNLNPPNYPPHYPSNHLPHHLPQHPPNVSIVPVLPVLYLIPEEELNLPPYYTPEPHQPHEEKPLPEETAIDTSNLPPFTLADVKVPASYLRIELMICFTILGALYGFGFLVLFQSIVIPVAKIGVVLGYIMLLRQKLIEPVTLEQALAQLPPT